MPLSASDVDTYHFSRLPRNCFISMTCPPTKFDHLAASQKLRPTWVSPGLSFFPKYLRSTTECYKVSHPLGSLGTLHIVRNSDSCGREPLLLPNDGNVATGTRATTVQYSPRWIPARARQDLLDQLSSCPLFSIPHTIGLFLMWWHKYSTNKEQPEKNVVETSMCTQSLSWLF